MKALRAPALTLAISLVAPLLGASSWIIPGVANFEIAGRAVFSSELTIVNSDSTAALATLSLIPVPGVTPPESKSYSVSGGQALTLGSVLDQVWAFQGIGAIRVSSDAHLSVFARTYLAGTSIGVPLPSPAFSSGSLPVIEEGQLLKSGDTGHSAWVSHSRDRTAGERTNVAVVFPSATGGAATVTLFDDQNNALGSVAYDSPGAAFFQSSIAAFTAAEVPIGRIAIDVTRGPACGYTAVVDNTTGDPSFVAAAPLPGPPPTSSMRLDFVSAGVVQTAGRNGAFWRTDARLANPGPNQINVTVYLLGSVTSSPQGISLAPGQTLEIRDLVQSLFNFSDAVSGMVLWRASGPLVIGTRVKTAYLSGTVGAIHDAVPLNQFSTLGDPPPVVPGLWRGASDLRTNLLAAAGPSGVNYELDLSSEDGSTLATSLQSLPPLGFAVTPLDSLLPSSAIQPRVQARARVLNGSVHLEAASAYNGNNDLVLYEALPRGTAAPSPTPTISIGSWGGAPNANDHLSADSSVLQLFRFCQTGTFPQPPKLDADGTFAVIGSYVVNVGPAESGDAILAGHFSGQRLTVAVLPLPGSFFNVDTTPETFVFGGAFTPFPGPCPVEQ